MYRVEARDLTQQPTLVARARLGVPQIRAWIGPALARVAARIEAAADHPVGPGFARFEPADERLDTFDVEVGFPVASAISPDGADLVASCLPGGPAAVTTHIGPYETMTPAYDSLEKWIADQGGTPVGAPWETHSDRTDADPSTWTTQIVLPYRIG